MAGEPVMSRQTPPSAAGQRPGPTAFARTSVALHRAADKHGVAVRQDATDDEIRKLVIGKAHPSLDLTDKDSAYLAAAFDLALDTLATRGATSVREDSGTPGQNNVDAMDELKTLFEARLLQDLFARRVKNHFDKLRMAIGGGANA